VRGGRVIGLGRALLANQFVGLGCTRVVRFVRVAMNRLCGFASSLNGVPDGLVVVVDEHANAGNGLLIRIRSGYLGSDCRLNE
jgi:hypothetical protein